LFGGQELLGKTLGILGVVSLDSENHRRLDEELGLFGKIVLEAHVYFPLCLVEVD
jgi:hypothetical protein